MQKLTVADIQDIKEKNKARLNLRKSGYRAKVVIHMGTCGVTSGALKIMAALKDEIAKTGLEDIMIIPAGCAGLCVREPMVTIETPNQPPVKYVDLNDEKIKEIFKEHIINGKPIEKYALVCGSESTY